MIPIVQIITFILISLIFITISESDGATMSKKTRCLNPPRTAKRVDTYIKDCKEEVKNKILKEAFEILRDQFKSETTTENYHSLPHLEFEYESVEIPRIFRRSALYHSTLVPHEDKRIAGCLLHCVYTKNNAIDKFGWPTLDGLVEFYSEGVSEHGFFMATLRAVNMCLHAATQNYHVNRHQPPKKGESCDLAFDVFDCISDQITNYCLNLKDD